jgi:hypothetical protein
MARPLMQNGIAQLEVLFAASTTDVKALKQLEGELKHRQVPRAVNLLAEVQAALRKTAKADNLHTAAEPSSAATVPVAATSTVPMAGPVVSPIPRLLRAAEVGSLPTLSAEAAYLLLKATPSTPWESVESVRRRLVDAAHPSRLAGSTPEKRAQVQESARRANAAYAVLIALRTASQ